MRQHPGIKIKELMDAEGLSEGELARRTRPRLTQPTVHRCVSQKTRSPKRETLQPIADYFHITIEDLEKKAKTGTLGKSRIVVSKTAYLAKQIDNLPGKQRDYVLTQIENIIAGLKKL